jgi:hypothetical protein
MTDDERTRIAAAALAVAHDIEAIVYHLRRVQHQLDVTARVVARTRPRREPVPDPTPDTDLETI